MASLLYMRLEGIEGEEPLGSDEKAIRLNSYSHNLTLPVAPMRPSVGDGATLRRSYCQHGHFQVTKGFDRTSPKLFNACANGVVFETVAIYLCMSAKTTSPTSDGYEPEPFLSILLKTSVIADFRYGYSGEWPVETLAFRYTSIGWKTGWVNPETGEDENLEPIGWDGAENAPAQLSIPSSVKWGQGGLM